jgi:hypothetical protein
MSSTSYPHYWQAVQAIRDGSCQDSLNRIFRSLARKIASTFDQDALNVLEYELKQLSYDDQIAVIGQYSVLPTSSLRPFPLRIASPPQSPTYDSTAQTPVRLVMLTASRTPTPNWPPSPSPFPLQFGPQPRAEARSTQHPPPQRARRAINQQIQPPSFPQTPTPSHWHEQTSIHCMLRFPNGPSNQNEFRQIYMSNDYMSIVEFSERYSKNLAPWEVLNVSMYQFDFNSEPLRYGSPHESSTFNANMGTITNSFHGHRRPPLSIFFD